MQKVNVTWLEIPFKTASSWQLTDHCILLIDDWLWYIPFMIEQIIIKGDIPLSKLIPGSIVGQVWLLFTDCYLL